MYRSKNKICCNWKIYIIQDIRSLKKDLKNLVTEMAKLTVDKREQFNQFYGYHQSADSERLNIA